MLAKQARKIQAPECGANMLLLAARAAHCRRQRLGDAPVVFFGAGSPEPAARWLTGERRGYDTLKLLQPLAASSCE